MFSSIKVIFNKDLILFFLNIRFIVILLIDFNKYNSF